MVLITRSKKKGTDRDNLLNTHHSRTCNALEVPVLEWKRKKTMKKKKNNNKNALVIKSSSKKYRSYPRTSHGFPKQNSNLNATDQHQLKYPNPRTSSSTAPSYFGVDRCRKRVQSQIDFMPPGRLTKHRKLALCGVGRSIEEERCPWLSHPHPEYFVWSAILQAEL